jgi:Ala-tRNA(Pro) deacylase
MIMVSGRGPKEVAMAAKDKLESYLHDNGVRFDAHIHREAFTAQTVAASEHVSGKQLAKAVMIVCDDDMVMAVLPAHEKVDLDRFKEVTGATNMRLAQESEFAPRFPDCDPGAQPPFGNLYDLPTYVDESLARHEKIVVQAGTHTDTVTLSYADYERLVRPRVAAFGEVEQG